MIASPRTRRRPAPYRGAHRLLCPSRQFRVHLNTGARAPSSLAATCATPQQLLAWNRGHWAIESKNHHRRDKTCAKNGMARARPHRGAETRAQRCAGEIAAHHYPKSRAGPALPEARSNSDKCYSASSCFGGATSTSRIDHCIRHLRLASLSALLGDLLADVRIGQPSRLCRTAQTSA